MTVTAFALLTACATPPVGDAAAGARAPLLEGFGAIRMAVATRVPAAEKHYRLGVAMAYAFDEREAVRQFKAALAADPRCALCAWGVAWQLGPTINVPRRAANEEEAKRHAELAQSLAAGQRGPMAARDRALMDTMALRYGGKAKAPADELPTVGAVCRSPSMAAGAARQAADPRDEAYARALQAMGAAFPDDPDIMALWAEAALIATPGDWWVEGGREPAAGIAAMLPALERAVAQHPEHTGVAHYLIHALDNPVTAPRALAAADRLAALAPHAPHLVHMPAHTYAHVGRYAQAAEVNERALLADEQLAQALRTQGFDSVSDWSGHNRHFLWFARLMEGRGDEALAAAQTLAKTATRWDHPYGEYQRALPLLTLARLQRHEAVLAAPAATGRTGVADAMTHHARGLAALRMNRGDSAQASLKELAASEAKVAALQHRGDTGMGRPVKQMALSLVKALSLNLQAELAAAEGEADRALALQQQAVQAAQALDRQEPPMLGAGMSLALADLQLRLGRAQLAEMSFRMELQDRPASGWALRGLAQALDAQGSHAVAAERERLLAVWPRADAALLSPARPRPLSP